MQSLYFLIPISLLICIGGVVLFFWAVKSGQYDDLDAEGERLLFDNEFDIHKKPEEKNQGKSEENDSKTQDLGKGEQ